MNVNKFVRTRLEKWKRYEFLLTAFEKKRIAQSSRVEIKEFSRLYKSLSADLAYTQTFFPESEVRIHLNNLIIRGHNYIYTPKYFNLKEIWQFFFYTFPYTFRKEARFFYLSCAIFFGFTISAFVLTVINENFATLIVPYHIIDHIHRNEMWTESIGKIIPSSVASSAIFTNNISVTFNTFAGGMVWGLGTFYILMINGVSLGTISSLCVMYDMSEKFFSFVIPHGLLEVSIILIAGAAGLILGDALINPGNLRRGENLKVRSRSSINLVLGGVPFLICCGLIEGYISPSGMFPALFKFFLGIFVTTGFYLLLFLNGIEKDQIRLKQERQRLLRGFTD